MRIAYVYMHNFNDCYPYFIDITYPRMTMMVGKLILLITMSKLIVIIKCYFVRILLSGRCCVLLCGACKAKFIWRKLPRETGSDSHPSQLKRAFI